MYQASYEEEDTYEEEDAYEEEDTNYVSSDIHFVLYIHHVYTLDIPSI
jgi:hypothetical protein